MRNVRVLLVWIPAYLVIFLIAFLPVQAQDKQMLQTSSIGDYVWYDRNGNGLQDETTSDGINNVQLFLYDDSGCDGIIGSGDILLQSAATSNDPETGYPGWYQFTGLPGGCYVVDVDDTSLPPNFVLTTTSDPYPVLLSEDETKSTVDFGYDSDGQIGDLVWLDSNNNGIFNVGEQGLNDVVVDLYQDTNCNGLLDGTDVFLQDQTTRSEPDPGYYNFTQLDGGCYLVDVDNTTLPPAAELTTISDPYPAVLIAGEHYAVADIGFYAVVTPTPIPTSSPTPLQTNTPVATFTATYTPTQAPIPATSVTGGISLLTLFSLLLAGALYRKR